MARTWPDEATFLVANLATQHIRTPSTFYMDDDGRPVWEFDPPLTAPEQADFDAIKSMVRSGITDVGLTAYRSIRADIQTIRDLRQLGRNAFMALPDAERFRRLYDAQSATTTILLALLRE